MRHRLLFPSSFRHVEYFCDKLDRFVYALKRLRDTASSEAAQCGYVSFVLSCGNLLWGNLVDVIKVFKEQKKSVRAICGAGYMDSCKPLFYKVQHLVIVMHVHQGIVPPRVLCLT